MSNTTKRLDPAAVAVLAAGGTLNEAAEAGEVSERTVRRHLSEDPLLRAEVQAMRDEMLASATGRLTAAATEVADRMVALALEPGTVTPAVRLRACEAVLAAASKLHADREIESRLAELEEMASHRWSA